MYFTKSAAVVGKQQSPNSRQRATHSSPPALPCDNLPLSISSICSLIRGCEVVFEFGSWASSFMLLALAQRHEGNTGPQNDISLAAA